MAYTAKIKSISKNTEREVVEVVIVYTDSVTTEEKEKFYTFSYDVTLEEIKKQARKYIKNVEGIDAVIAGVPVGTDLDLTKSAKDKKKEELEQTVAKIDSTRRLVELGVKTQAEADTELTPLKEKAKQLTADIEK